MSRTDGHEPYWVYNDRYGYVDHDHRDGICVVCRHRSWKSCDCYEKGKRTWQSRPCYQHAEWWAREKSFGKYPAEKYYANQFERAERRRIKAALHRGDWEDEGPYRHRHGSGWYCD